VTDQARYQIRVEGWIDERWAYWFEHTSVCAEQTPDGAPITTLRGSFDQAALRGTLIKLWDLNLALLSVSRDETRGERPNGECDQIV
jgi:hypothetical protein